MQTRIDQRFADLRATKKKGFVAYVCVGDPGLKQTLDIVLRLEDAGADVIELGIPFSDPLADGKSNQEASARALEAGASVQGVLDCVEKIRKRSNVPLLFFSYLNPIYAYGIEKLAKAASEAGVDGLLALDLPVEEAAETGNLLHAQGLNHVILVAPTSTDDRIRKVARASTGFIYCVSREGVTGAQEKLGPQADRLLKQARRCTDLPLALGFGISTPAQAAAAAKHADAVVVGSAIVQKFHDCGNHAAGRAKAARWVKTMINAVKKVS